jgi:hypothetical protein
MSDTNKELQAKMGIDTDKIEELNEGMNKRIYHNARPIGEEEEEKYAKYFRDKPMSSTAKILAQLEKNMGDMSAEQYLMEQEYKRRVDAARAKQEWEQ